MKILHLSALMSCALGLLTAPSCVSTKRFEALERRVDELNTSLTNSTADADNDGVIDLRDLEPRTPGDVEVDRFGRTVVKKVEPTPPVYTPPPTTTQPTPQPTNDPTTTPPDRTQQPYDPNVSRPDKEPMDESDTAGDYHVVVKGDTLFSLARRYNTSVQNLRQLNRLGSNEIQVGQRLRVR
jgi:LysM repeat protein